MAQNALADPKAIVTLLIYTSVARLALTHFPPLWFPRTKEGKIDWDGCYVHFLRYEVLILLLARITRTYAYAMNVKEDDIRVFLLELAIAFVLAAQFRILDSLERVEDHKWNLCFFYFLQLAIFASTFAWAKLASGQLPVLAKTPTALWIGRIHGLASSFGGILVEAFCQNGHKRQMIRTWYKWFFTVGMAVNITWYFFGNQPWTISTTPAPKSR